MKFLSRQAFLIVILLSMAVIVWTHSNQWLFYKINAGHRYLPDTVWLVINFLTYPRYFILPVLLIALTWVKRREMLINVVVAIVAYYVLFDFLKITVAEARPHMVLDPHTFYWLNRFEDAIKNAHRSFPSGHTGLMAVFAFSLNHLFFERKPLARVAMLLLLVLTMLARICTGWHWPIDVLASAAIGFALVQLAFSFQVTRRKR